MCWAREKNCSFFLVKMPKVKEEHSHFKRLTHILLKCRREVAASSVCEKALLFFYVGIVITDLADMERTVKPIDRNGECESVAFYTLRVTSKIL